MIGTVKIFQSPTTLIVLSAIALIIVVFIRQTWPEKRKFWQLLIPPAMFAAAFALDYFVKTDLEKINMLIDRAAQAFVDENANAIEPLIAADYSDKAHHSKMELMTFTRVLLTNPLVEKARQISCIVEITDPQAVATIKYYVFLERETVYTTNLMQIEMKLHLKKLANKNWLIKETEILTINKQRFSWKDVP